MVLTPERDRGKPEWPPCMFREIVREKYICTNGFAIGSYRLIQPPEELTRRIKSGKPSLREFGELPYSSICRSCTYRQV